MSIMVNSMAGLNAANNDMLAVMSRKGAKNSMSMKPMKAEHHRDTRSEQVDLTTKQRLGRTMRSQIDCEFKGTQSPRERGPSHTRNNQKRDS